MVHDRFQETEWDWSVANCVRTVSLRIQLTSVSPKMSMIDFCSPRYRYLTLRKGRYSSDEAAILVPLVPHIESVKYLSKVRMNRRKGSRNERRNPPGRVAVVQDLLTPGNLNDPNNCPRHLMLRCDVYLGPPANTFPHGA